MTKNLKKSAKFAFPEKKVFYEGILNREAFEENYMLRCYEPSQNLAPFVEHYFVSRRRNEYSPRYTGSDVLAQPVVSLFIMPGLAFFLGPTTSKRTIKARNLPMYVGAQFKPGGFYPFWKRKISEMAEKAIPVSEVLPTDVELLTDDLLAVSDDQEIVKIIDTALQHKRPKYDRHLKLISEIIAFIESNASTITVGAVATHFAISERKLQHLFQTYVGVGVKWGIKRVRFLEIIMHTRRQSRTNWTTVALDLGYSDQSHFINDFKKLVGQSPNDFIKSGK